VHIAPEHTLHAFCVSPEQSVEVAEKVASFLREAGLHGASE